MKYLLRVFSFLLAIVSLTSCYEVTRNCTDFKTGTFEFEALVGTELTKTTFVRNDSIEIDYYKGVADTSTIRWINDCEYVVTKKNPKNQAERKSIHMKILSTDATSYMFEYKLVGESNKERGTAVKISDNTSR
ncbi:DNA topoisomerase IV [Rasiella rasia]|uniref:DNA topoisomerase IV n=1 Tax=Rasiella rasia TaxID=2744027 RepID=A0A6G6GJ34_9FLAO|nr:DNA topoisomerase IV [Rasiella rasia]QIE58558.1 DNA topoisomerase IV [Rasiella rasia]